MSSSPGSKHFFGDQLARFVGGRDQLPSKIWQLIAWLEDRGQAFQFRNTKTWFVPTVPITSLEAMWSNIYFQIDDCLVSSWFGHDVEADASLIPLVRCGGDGSYLAQWRQDGGGDRYVFLGSEGEAFIVADSMDGFIALITMGYYAIECRADLDQTPKENWSESEPDRPWPGAAEVQLWVKQNFSIDYPTRGSDLVPNLSGADPFSEWVAQNSN